MMRADDRGRAAAVLDRSAMLLARADATLAAPRAEGPLWDLPAPGTAKPTQGPPQAARSRAPAAASGGWKGAFAAMEVAIAKLLDAERNATTLRFAEAERRLAELEAQIAEMEKAP